MPTPIDVGDASPLLQQGRDDSRDVNSADLDHVSPASLPALPIPAASKGVARSRASSPIRPPDDSVAAAPDLKEAPNADYDPEMANAQPAPDETPPAPKEKPGFFSNLPSEFGNALARGVASVARAVTMTGEGLSASANAEAQSAAGQTPEGDSEDIKAASAKVVKAATDVVNYFKPAHPEQSGLGSQVVGDVAGIIPALFAGPAGVPLVTAGAASDAYNDAVDSGQDAKTAAILATIAAATNALGMKIPLKSPNIWKRIGSSILGNSAITLGAQTLTKEILNSSGYKEAAEKIDPTDPRTILSTLVTAVLFGLHRQAGADTKTADENAKNGVPPGAPAPPSAEAAAPPPPPAPPSPDAAAAPASTPTPPPPPAPAAKAPDTPSVEPAAALRAQVRDMNNKDTPRVGVLVPKGNEASLAGSKDANALAFTGILNQARTQGRTVQTEQGELILKTKKIAEVTKARLANGEDPQAVIGSVTGAGTGKPEGPAVVVQGKDDTGNVTSETMVPPADATRAAQDIEAQGKTVSVTTPEAAVSDRIAAVSQERNTPTQIGIMTDPTGKEVAVHVEPGAPEGKLRIRKLDEDGEPTSTVFDVAKDRVKLGKPTEDTTTPKTVETAPPPNAGKEAEQQAPSGVAKEGVNTETLGTKTPPPPEGGVLTSKPGASSESENQAKTEAAPPAEKLPVAGAQPKEDTAQSAPEPAAPKVKVTNKKTGETSVVEAAKSKAAEPATEKSIPQQQPKPKAKKIQTPLEALPAALEAHEKQEVVPAGRKNLPLGERQENAGLFARILKAAAESARGKASPSDIERATKAAKAAEALSEYDKEKTAKGFMNHVKLSAIVSEMHKAARVLLGAAKEGDEVIVKPEEAHAANKLARDRARVLKKAGIENPDETPAPKVRRVRKTVKVEEAAPKEESKPQKQTGVQLERETNRLRDRFIHADEEDLPQAQAELEKHIRENYSDIYTPDQQRELLHLLTEQRLEENPLAEQTGPRKMSETVEDEPQNITENLDAKTIKTLGLRTATKHALSFAVNKLQAIKHAVFNNKMATQYHNLAVNMARNGHFADLINAHNSGNAVSTHAMLDKMIASADGPELKALLEKIRSKTPDLPIYSVSQIKDLRTGGNLRGPAANGLFDPKTNSIQVVPDRQVPANTVKTLVHEIVHAATSYEIKKNPTGYLATALENARLILVKRLASMHGEQNIIDHFNFFNGNGERPANFDRSLYGIANTQEMLAELHSNPEFIEKIADSEMFANKGENFEDILSGGKKTLLHRIFGAIGRLFGVSDPKLLQHIAGLGEKVMDVQARKSAPGEQFAKLAGKSSQDFASELAVAMRREFGANPLEINRAMPSLEAVAKEPPPLRGVEDQVMRSFADDETAREPITVARLFKQAAGSGIVDGVRAIKASLKTVPQLFRDYRRDFGNRNDPANPLNRMQDIERQKAALMHDMGEHARDVGRRWMRVNDRDNVTIGTMVQDWTMNKIDPRKEFAAQPAQVRDDPQGRAKYEDFLSKWKQLKDENPEAASIVNDVFDANRKLLLAERRANIDSALEAFTDKPVSDGQRAALYAARAPEQFDEMVGPGKLIDIGDNNDKLRGALKDFAGKTELEGPYAHLGRFGDYVVSAKSEGTKTGFRTKEDADAFAARVNSLSPGSKATYQFRGGDHQVDYKAQYISFHETRNQAEEEHARMEKQGYDLERITRKSMSSQATPLSQGARDLSAAVEAKLKRMGAHEEGEANNPLLGALRSAMLHLSAARSAHAASQLARKNFAGVKPEEMRRAFANHTESTIWHTAQLRTTFKQASALAELRNMARTSNGASQETMYRRGEMVDALNRHMQDEVQNYGHKSPLNAAMARLGFMSYLGSTSHAFIWMTQNYTTGMPTAGARWGYGKAISTFQAAMNTVLGPAMRDAVHQAFEKGGAAREANEAMLSVLSKHDRWSKWLPQIKQMIREGTLGHGYGNELHEMAQSTGTGAKLINRTFDFARLLPSMADSFNRVSTALTALEMTGGDIRKAADFVDEIHADYSAQAKPLAFKKIGRVPGMNTLTMFKTYTQSMIHLFYGNLKNAMVGGGESGRWESAKIAAGMVVANTLFAGVYGGAAIEPLKLLIYGYHKVFDKEGEVFDLKNAIHNWLVENMGKTAGDAAAGGLPHLAGFDLSSRMGLTDLFFHDPPDLFTSDKSHWNDLAGALSGPMFNFLADRTTQFSAHMQKGEAFQAISSLIPVKQYQDAVEAYQYATTGKMNSLGGQMTKPSALDATYKFLGLKPSSVAEAQEAVGTQINYNSQVRAAKSAIIKAYVSAATKGDMLKAQGRMNEFNKLHPAEAIKGRDIRSMMKGKELEQSNAPGKDETLNKMLSYTRK